VRLGDASPTGRLRLDALARYLQDVAGDDVEESGVGGAWVVRRARLLVGELPRFREVVELETFCSGYGRQWAERRTTVRVDGESRIESAALWVFVDHEGRPASLEDWFFDVYGTAANGRRVSPRLRLPSPPPDATRRAWAVRGTDLDVLGHVNNAIAWAAIEDELADGRAAAPARICAAEIEYRAPVDADDDCELRSVRSPDGLACWLVVGDQVRVAARVVQSS
jgi:acyl-ACP thioesterase